MSGRVMVGTETEYAITGLDDRGERVPSSELNSLVIARAAERPHLPGAESGLFLANGARLYVDAGHHIEYASPETLDPWAGLTHALAGDRLLIQLAEEIARANARLGSIVVGKGNVGYDDPPSTWASHENYLFSIAPSIFRPRLVPHLVSRMVFTGAGGFDPFETERPRFVLSPRALFMRRVVALATLEHGRGIVDEREQPHCVGFHRQHLICGDGLRSELGSFLRLGTTALVVALIDAGLDEGEAVILADPLAALQTVARDVSLCRALRLSNGESTTAVAVQRHYLRRARANLNALPQWALTVCDLWDDTLTRLEQGPAAVATRLDWAIKLSMFSDRTLKRERPADDLAIWRAELCELDTRFGQIHPPGLFDVLDAAGVLDHHVDGIDNVDAAVTTPPDGGRASVRGKVVTRNAAERHVWICSWDRIEDKFVGMKLDLSDPFVEEERWRNPLGVPESAPALVGNIFRAARTPSSSATLSLRSLVERLCDSGSLDVRRRVAGTAIDLNNLAVDFRKMGRLEEAEWLMRAALAIDIDSRSADHPKVAHRRMNLATVLLLQGRVGEAREELERGWAVIGSRFDITSVRILVMRLTVAMMEHESTDLFLGQLKTHVGIHPLRDFADVVRRWDIRLSLERLAPRLEAADAALLNALVVVANGDQPPAWLDSHPRWRDAAARALVECWANVGVL